MAEQVKDREELRELMAKAMAQSVWDSTVQAVAKRTGAAPPETVGEVDWQPFLPGVDAQLAALAEAGVAMVPEDTTEEMALAAYRITQEHSPSEFEGKPARVGFQPIWGAALAAGRIDR